MAVDSKTCRCRFQDCERPLHRYRVYGHVVVTWADGDPEDALMSMMESLRVRLRSISRKFAYDDGAGVTRCVRCGVELSDKFVCCRDCADYFARQKNYEEYLKQRLVEVDTELYTMLRARLEARGSVLELFAWRCC